MNLLDEFSARSLSHFGNEGFVEFSRRLREDGQVCCTRCTACDSRVFPPRSHCPDCLGEELGWEPFPTGGTIHAFTTQARALRFAAPAVIGVVDVPGLGKVLAPIAGRMEELSIGQRVEPEVIEAAEGIAYFRFVAT